MAKPKKEHNPFYYRHGEHSVRFWLGHPDDPESEFVMDIHPTLILALIAALRGCLGDKLNK